MGSIDKCCTDCSIMNIVISWSILHRHCNTAPSDGLNLDAERSARSLSELSFGRATHHTITGIMTVITEYWCSQTPDDRFFNNINSLLSFCWYAVRWRCDQIYNGHLGNVTSVSGPILNPHALMKSSWHVTRWHVTTGDINVTTGDFNVTAGDFNVTTGDMSPDFM